MSILGIVTSGLSRSSFSSSNETNLQIQIDTRPLLINTVRLSLSLLFCSDLVLILQRGVLPLLQQLSVAFQRRNPHVEHRPTRFKVNELNLLTTDTSRLRTFSLRNLPMNYALRFIRFLRLTQLQTLCLINIFDKSKSINNTPSPTLYTSTVTHLQKNIIYNVCGLRKIFLF